MEPFAGGNWVNASSSSLSATIQSLRATAMLMWSRGKSRSRRVGTRDRDTTGPQTPLFAHVPTVLANQAAKAVDTAGSALPAPLDDPSRFLPASFEFRTRSVSLWDTYTSWISKQGSRKGSVEETLWSRNRTTVSSTRK